MTFGIENTIIILNDIPLANNLHNNVITLTAKIDANNTNNSR
ncbi:hypothetical protein KPMX200_40159 [Klebsiella pneumoniae]|nr:hypothetical protein KPMX200_40159 [Klebsiella pneumoniae]